MKRMLAMLLSAVVILGGLAWCIIELPGREGWDGAQSGGGEVTAMVEHIRVECGSGDVTVCAQERTGILIEELPLFTNAAAPQQTLRWAVSGKTLRISCGDAEETAGYSYAYRITVPASMPLNDLDLIGGRMAAHVQDLTLRDLTLRAEKGAVTVERCKCIDACVAELGSAELVMGGVFARRFDIESESGSVVLGAPTFQRDCKVDTDSGNIAVYLPAGSAVNVTERHGSGSFENDFETAQNAPRFRLTTRSGQIGLRAEEAPQPAA